MDNLDNAREEHPKEYYDAIPVVYCKNCLSLKIMVLNDKVDYCDECGYTDTESTDIKTWREMYKKKYGKPF